MKQIQQWQQKQPLLSAISAAIIGTLIIAAAQYFIGMPDNGSNSRLLTSIVITVCIVGLVTLFHRWDCFANKTQNLSAIFSRGWYLIIVSMYFVVLLLLSPQLIAPTGRDVAIYTGATLLTVISEELLFRGIVQNILMKYWSRNQWTIVVVAAAIFALVHLLALVDSQPKFVATFTQVIYVFFLGLMLGAIYATTRNIIATIGLHSIFNFFGSISELFQPASPAAQQDSSIVSALIVIIPMIPCYFIAKHQIRKAH